jgi:flagellar basal body-associated protein FliL
MVAVFMGAIVLGFLLPIARGSAAMILLIVVLVVAVIAGWVLFYLAWNAGHRSDESSSAIGGDGPQH